MDPCFGAAPPLPLVDPALRKLFSRENDEVCSAHDFLALMPGVEECQEKDRDLLVYWYPEMNKSHGNFNPISSSSVSGQPQSIQHKIKSLLLSLYLDMEYGDLNGYLVQFWAPETTITGQTVLSVFGQPFGVNELYNGFCKYRHHCLNQESSVKDISELNHIGRVFKNRSSEVCEDIESCSTDEFPVRTFADCGIRSYCATPLFEPGYDRNRCVGVLEFLSFRGDKFLDITNIKFLREQIFSRLGVLDTLDNVLDAMEINFGLVWVPCICDEPGAKAVAEYEEDSCTLLNAPRRFSNFFGQWRWTDWDANYDSEEFDLDNRTYFLRNGKSWVERAYSLNKLCFVVRDINKCSISNYPFFLEISSVRYAIPLTLIANFPPLIVEVVDDFGLYNGENVKDLLEDFLNAMWSRFVDEYGDTAFRRKKFSVEVSDRDDNSVFYFDVSQWYETDHHLQLPQQSEDNVKDPGTDNTAEDNEASIPIDMVTIGSSTNAYAQISTTLSETGRINFAAENLVNNQPQTHHTLGDGREPQPSSLHTHQATVEAIVPHTNTADKAKSSKGVDIEIDIDRIKQCFGKKLADAARELGVSRSTLKRRCRDLGYKRWPSHKKNKVDCIPPNPQLANRTLDVGGEVVEEPEKRHGKDIAIEKGTNQTETMIVKATYGDDAVKFRLASNSGFNELIKALKGRFDLGSKRFKIKYEDKEDDDWIMMAGDEDLRFHIDTLASTGQTRMNLKLFSITE